MAYLSQFVTDATGYTDPATVWNIFRVPEIDERLRELNVQSPVFYKVLEMLPSGQPARQAKFEWAEDDIPKNYTLLNHGGGYNAVATSIVVDDCTVFVIGDAVRTMTHNEIMLITNITAGTNTLTVTRGHQGSTAAVIDDNEVLMVLHYELGESDTAPSSRGKVPTEKYNYISQFSRTFDVSELNEATDVRYNIGKITRETAEKAFIIRRDIANQLLYGKRYKGPNHNSKTYYSTGGFYSFATSNAISSLASALTWESLFTFDGAFEPTSSSARKALLCGSTVYETLAKLSYNKTTFSEYNDTLGCQVMRIVLPSGNEIDVVKDRYTFDSTLGQAGKGILVDTAHLELVWLNGWELKWKQNIQNNNVHSRQDEIYGACGLKVVHPEVHGTITLT